MLRKSHLIHIRLAAYQSAIKPTAHHPGSKIHCAGDKLTGTTPQRFYRRIKTTPTQQHSFVQLAIECARPSKAGRGSCPPTVRSCRDAFDKPASDRAQQKRNRLAAESRPGFGQRSSVSGTGHDHKTTREHVLVCCKTIIHSLKEIALLSEMHRYAYVSTAVEPTSSIVFGRPGSGSLLLQLLQQNKSKKQVIYHA